MDGEVEKNNKKKQIILILVGVVTLLVAILGATYAYFQINTNNESSNTTVTGSTPKSGLVTIKGVTDNLHINLKASDMSYDNRTKEYYGTDGEEPYVEKEEDGTKTIAEVELTGGEETTKYSCTAKLTVSKITNPEEEKDTMIDVLQPGDLILQFKGDIISEKVDLSELKSTGSKEYDLNFKITGNATKDIQAYIKLINKITPQKDLAGKKLNIDISTSELKCNVVNVKTTLDKLRYEDIKSTLSKNTVGGMYRYQGVGREDAVDSTHKLVDNNYICFGTDNKENCTNEETGYDKYMYRIIGITEEGQLYLIKMKGVEEENTNEFQWNSKYAGTNCDGDKCEWPNADLFKRLNGTSSNGNPIFINSSNYEYLKDYTWYNKIDAHNWLYGYVSEISNMELEGETVYGANNNGLILYDIETGIKPTKYYELIDNETTNKKYQWDANRKVPAKIGLMYIHDYYLAYDNDHNFYNGNSVYNWLMFYNDKDPRIANTPLAAEWSISKWGITPNNYSYVWTRFPGGNFNYTPGLSDYHIVRPTFYLNSTTKIKSGTGNITDPFILEV